MPELIEVEMYRATAERCVGHRVIAAALAPGYGSGVDEPAFRDAVVGGRVEAVGRRGKLAWLDLDRGVRIGMRFGMTGRLVIDGEGPIDRLRYGPATAEGDDPWQRCALTFDGGTVLSISDPRRFGSVSLDPDVSVLGPDAADISTADLRGIMASPASLKSLLLDQRRIAGLGNLLVDEILWRGGRLPTRAGSSLVRSDIAPTARLIRSTIRELSRRGGSHTGDHVDQRNPGGHCPRDGNELCRGEIAGRTTYWCPIHQR